MATRLGDEAQRRVDLLFSAEARESATRLLIELQDGFSDLDEGAFGLERVQFAALKVSHGDVNRLRKAIEVGQRDFRDLLSAAGFMGLHTHRRWRPKPGKGAWWDRLREGMFGVR